MVYLETDDTGRVTLRHNRPEQINTSGGVVVDSISDSPGEGYELYVVDGAPAWKQERYQYRNDLPAMKKHLRKKVLERQVGEETKPVTYDGNEYPCGRDSQGRIGTALRQVEQTGKAFPAMTTSGKQVKLSLSELEDLAAAYADQVRSARKRGQELRSKIDAATGASELLSLDLGAGW